MGRLSASADGQMSRGDENPAMSRGLATCAHIPLLIASLTVIGCSELSPGRSRVLTARSRRAEDGGAAIALRDTFVWPGPERVVREVLIATRRYTSFEDVETTTAARRCAGLGARERLVRRAQVATRVAYGVRLRAYDRNTLGFARLRDVLGRG